jgi:hypothetical protein
LFPSEHEGIGTQCTAEWGGTGQGFSSPFRALGAKLLASALLHASRSGLQGRGGAHQFIALPKKKVPVSLPFVFISSCFRFLL